jgi:hypothetical protein
MVSKVVQRHFINKHPYEDYATAGIDQKKE